MAFAKDLTAALRSALDQGSEQFEKLSSGQKVAVVAVGGLTGLYAASKLLLGRSSSTTNRHKPSTLELSGGSIPRDKVASEFQNYSASFEGVGQGQGLADKSKNAQLVDVFYSLVTDIYEWGWGQSFHFSPKLPTRNWSVSEIAHEARLGAVLRARPGQKVLDVGCGVGGPMRTIAAVTGAHTVGITINEYQVQRAIKHNVQNGLAPLTTVLRGDFTRLPFEDNSFDAAYAIEATCHATKLEDVYGEVLRVLKPGGVFVSYEWVCTAKFNPANPEHVKVIEEINYGNGLPEMRTFQQAEAAGRAVGFELSWSQDMATASPVCGPWYARLSALTWMHSVNHAVVSFFDALRLTPRGLKEVHHMLVTVARSLIRGGETGVFSPMHMLVFTKPAAAK